jgi:hypothetical protein
MILATSFRTEKVILRDLSMSYGGCPTSALLPPSSMPLSSDSVSIRHGGIVIVEINWMGALKIGTNMELRVSDHDLRALSEGEGGRGSDLCRIGIKRDGYCPINQFSWF